jgi:hypothetical protein
VEKLVESESKKIIDRERSMMDCGTKQIREKVGFNWG